MRVVVGLALLAGIVAAAPADAEDLTIAISSPTVEITSNFTGADITVFGVVEDAVPGVEYDVVVALRGPAQNIAVRRKDRVAGIWINQASETVLAVPGFYALRTSAPLWQIADPETRENFLLGTDHLGFVYRGKVRINDPSAAEFRDAFLRLKTEADLFSEATDISFLADAVFRTTIRLPASTPVGRYSATGFVFRDGQLVARVREIMNVNRVGGERFLFEFSRNQAFLYGIAAVAMALFVGWLGGVLFRRD